MELSFNLPEPADSDLGGTLSLWGTFYYGQPAAESSTGVEILNRAGQVVGPRISEKDWCHGAMEGTLIVKQADGATVTYNFDGTASTRQASCKPFFTRLSEEKLAALEKTRFRRARGPFGDGAQNFVLSPYRTLAVDRTKIALGTALYIRSARGVSITLPDNSSAIHDGYFFAGDVGGAIKDNHVDFFLGVSLRNPFPFVKSKDSETFEVREVLNAGTRQFLRGLHEL
jgi:3D (Asp-Asp-Asp) domain-containing protein